MTRAVVALGAFALLNVACASRPSSERTVAPDLGSPADMTTKLGAYDGYVVGKCTVRGQERVYVQGTGSERILPPDWHEWQPLAMERLRGLAGYMGHSSGFANACKGGGLVVFVEAWNKMDWAIRLIGERLREADVSDVVTLAVESIPTILDH